MRSSFPPARRLPAWIGPPPRVKSRICRLIGFRHCRSTVAAETYLRANGGDPQWVFRSDDNATIQALVVAGIGVALVPRLTVDEMDPNCAVVATDVPPRVLTLAWHRDRYRSTAQVAFVELARQVCLELQQKVAPTLAAQVEPVSADARHDLPAVVLAAE
jgi:DNA-binding transcriptional LysR family regulator